MSHKHANVWMDHFVLLFIFYFAVTTSNRIIISSEPCLLRQAPALPVQPRRILSALRTVELPHYCISSSARYHLPNLRYLPRIPQPYLLLIVLMHPNHSFSLPTLGKKNDTPLCNHGSISIFSRFSQQTAVARCIIIIL